MGPRGSPLVRGARKTEVADIRPPALAQVGQQLRLQKTSEDRFSFQWALKVDDPP